MNGEAIQRSRLRVDTRKWLLAKLQPKKYGERITFWGGGVNTQKTLPFGTPDEVRAEVTRRCEVFSKGGGFVFNTIHNILPDVPPQNVVAMFEAVDEYR